ncbi:hypothetical protein ACOJBO_17345 [Rhizobium beringeri]
MRAGTALLFRQEPDERMEIASMIDDDPPWNPLAQPFTRSRAWPRFST